MFDYHSVVIKQRMAKFLKSADFDEYFDKLHIPRVVLWGTGIIAPFTLVGLPVAKSAWKKIWHGDAASNRLRQRYEQLGETGKVVFTYVVIANTALKYNEGTNAPALVVGNFNDGKDDQKIMELRDKLADAALGLAEDQEGRELSVLLRDDDYTFQRRRQIPTHLTGGISLTAFDLQIVGKHLPTRTLQIEAIPCIAEPGERGLICMIPFHLIEDTLADIERAMKAN